LLLVLPILVGFLFGIVEFGFVMAANQRVETAAREACRVAAGCAEAGEVVGEAKVVLVEEEPNLNSSSSRPK